MKESNLQIFQYNGSPVTFNLGDSVMVNATEMAKPFGKRAKDWLKLQSAKEFIQTLSEGKNILSTDLVKVIYGDNGGTWMHEDVALEFARWLAPAFAIWCNDRIKELLTGNNASTLTIETVDRLKEALAMAQTTINRQASEIRDKSDLIADLEEIAKAIRHAGIRQLL